MLCLCAFALHLATPAVAAKDARRSAAVLETRLAQLGSLEFVHDWSQEGREFAKFEDAEGRVLTLDASSDLARAGVGLSFAGADGVALERETLSAKGSAHPAFARTIEMIAPKIREALASASDAGAPAARVRGALDRLFSGAAGKEDAARPAFSGGAPEVSPKLMGYWAADARRSLGWSDSTDRGVFVGKDTALWVAAQGGSELELRGAAARALHSELRRAFGDGRNYARRARANAFRPSEDVRALVESGKSSRPLAEDLQRLAGWFGGSENVRTISASGRATFWTGRADPDRNYRLRIFVGPSGQFAAFYQLSSSALIK